MMRISVLCLILFLFACTDNNKVPKDILPQDKMQKLMWDMVRADRFANQFIIPKADSLKKDSAVFAFYNQVFQLNGITDQEFLKSYKFYLGRPDLMKIMFDSIAAQAERKKADVYKKMQADSTRKKIIK
jgi:hypothetical protein